MDYIIQSFNTVVDGIPYLVETREYDYNGEKRFLVSYNGGGENVFVFNPEINQYVSKGENTSTIPDSLEKAISDQLIDLVKNRQK